MACAPPDCKSGPSLVNSRGSNPWTSTIFRFKPSSLGVSIEGCRGRRLNQPNAVRRPWPKAMKQAGWSRRCHRLVTRSFGSLAQLVERLPYKQGVGGSSPSGPTGALVA